MKNTKTYIAGAILVTCAGACLFTGCFFSKQQEMNIPPLLEPQAKINNYDNLVNDWNNFVNDIYLDDSYYLEKDKKAVVVALKKLFNNITEVKEFKKQNSCILKYPNKSIFKPSFEYIQFLDKYSDLKNSNFDITINEHDLIEKLKDITNSRYFDRNVLKVISSLNSFEYFFKYHKKAFYKDGFTRNIKKYEEYQKIIQKCK